MNILRKVKKSVNTYIKLLSNDSQNAKAYCTEYLQDVELLQNVLEAHLNCTTETFQKWCDASVKVFESECGNIFLYAIKSIKMILVNHFLNRYSYELSVNSMLQEDLIKIEERLSQFKYLC